MAKGSEQFAWKLYPGVPRVCAGCQRDLTRELVGRVHTRTLYEDGLGRRSTVFYCVDCRHVDYRAAA